MVHIKNTTINLRSYPIRKRLVIWQATHKKLLGDDARYRRRFHAYLTTVVAFSCVLLAFYLPFFGIRLYGFEVDIAIILSLVAVMVYLAVWQLRFTSQQIDHYLKSSHDA